ncbi:MAG: YlbF family regulator [Bacillota bacterium]
MNPYNAAHNLAKALRESAEFKEMKDATEALKADQPAKQMVMDFRNKQFELEKQKLSGVEVSKDQEEKLQKLLEVVNMNLTAKRYLQAEYKMAMLLQDIQKIISDATSEIYDSELMGLTEDDGEQQT